MNIQDYAVTLKDNRTGVNVDWALYEDIIASLEKRGAILCQKAYEYDSKGILHVHCYFQAKKNFFWAKCIPKGIHRDVRVLKSPIDKKAWAHYLMKPDLAQYSFQD